MAAMPMLGAATTPMPKPVTEALAIKCRATTTVAKNKPKFWLLKA
jgi:hypothetical protein